LGSSLGQRGLQESGVGATAEAGLRSAAINNASQQAFGSAMGLAGQQANVLSGGFGAANQLLAGSLSGLQQADPAIAGGGLKGGGQRAGTGAGGGGGAVPGQPLGASQAGGVGSSAPIFM
jgi:hypothetical protein